MWLVGLGVLLALLKLSDVPPVAAWDWWVTLSPFGLAVVWWAWADSSGYTQRKAMDRMDERKEKRRQKALDNLGRGDKGKDRP